MGYQQYATAAGEAGYGVTDTCWKTGCDVEIDRGLAYLCGGTPGEQDEAGCGKWFCGEHLLGKPEALEDMAGAGQCENCSARWTAAHPDLVAAEDQRWLPLQTAAQVTSTDARPT